MQIKFGERERDRVKASWIYRQIPLYPSSKHSSISTTHLVPITQQPICRKQMRV